MGDFCFHNSEEPSDSMYRELEDVGKGEGFAAEDNMTRVFDELIEHPLRMVGLIRKRSADSVTAEE